MQAVFTKFLNMSLTGSIVNGLTEDFHAIIGIHTHNLRVSSADQETKEGIGRQRLGRFLRRANEMSQNVPLKMIGFNEGNAQRKSQPLGKRDTNQQRPHESGTEGDSHCAQLGRLHACFLQRTVHHGNDVLLMGTGSKFGHYPAPRLMHLLRSGDVGKKETITNHGSRSVVATGFYG